VKSGFLNKMDKWLTRSLSYPGINKDSLAQEKLYWIASVAVTTMILCLTIVYHIVFPQLRIIIYYGLFLTAIYIQGVILPLIIHSVGVRWQFINSVLVEVATLICILKLGGIPNSGGLIFVGLAIVFFTLNFREKSHSLWIFVIYVITIIIAGILHPYLTVPAEMTPAVNISLFVINLLWISGFAGVFIMNFISQRVKLEQFESFRLRELDEARTKLYTNMTHEFRTPLTIILGMADLIAEKPEKWLDEGLKKIENNSKILLHLVNQMLDLSRLEKGAMPVNMIQGDIVLYIRYLIELFNSVAESKQISLKYTPDPGHLIIDYDPDKMMEIVSNIISNALKYTQEGGHVEVRTELAGKSDQNYRIIISDNGPGIPEDKVPYIFDRFFRIENPAIPSVRGSGLGLALTQELIKLLNGSIAVESVLGIGTEFIVSLPVTCNAPFCDDSKPFEIKSVSTFLTHHEKLTPSPESREAIRPNKPLLLIVEDSRDVIQYLYHMLEPNYNVLTALNGLEGVKKAVDFIPDIILSDIMMPEMDGIELLNSIKNDARTSHIPVVILTAKADVLSRIEGLKKGADAYIAKPFNKEELQLQLKKLIEHRKKMQERYAAMGHFIDHTDEGFELEDAFMQKIHTIMTEKLNDEKFNIQILCHELAMSRTQVYRKFKSLTNKTISDYLRSLRLRKAREILSTSKYNVTEAAYMTGFKNLSHFSKVFTREFGIKPSDFNK
jgi:signal transduction histidine kinase/DNA-binding response OmpR family regulator